MNIKLHKKPKLIDRYYRTPIIVDFATAFIALVAMLVVQHYDLFKVQAPTHFWEITMNIGILSIAIAGISLTIHTILITLRISSNEAIQNIKGKKEPNEFEEKVHLFFTKLYPKTTKVLLGCIIELGIVVIIAFLLLIFEKHLILNLMFWVTLSLLIIVTMAFFRCVHVFALVTNLFANNKKAPDPSEA